jgi:hypothetical protein
LGPGRAAESTLLLGRVDAVADLGELDDKALLRAFKGQQARSRAADDMAREAQPGPAEWRACRIAQEEHEALAELAAEMRRRTEVYEALRDVAEGWSA